MAVPHHVLLLTRGAVRATLVVGTALALTGCGSGAPDADSPAEEQVVADVESALQYWRDRAGIEWTGEALGRLTDREAPVVKDDQEDWVETEVLATSGTNVSGGARATVRYTSHVAAFDDTSLAGRDVEEETITRCVELVVGAHGSLHDGSWDWVDCPT